MKTKLIAIIMLFRIVSAGTGLGIAAELEKLVDQKTWGDIQRRTGELQRLVLNERKDRNDDASIRARLQPIAWELAAKYKVGIDQMKMSINTHVEPNTFQIEFYEPVIRRLGPEK